MNPEAAESCNGFDDDCDGETDESSALDARLWYLDADLDGFGDPISETASCAPPAGFVVDGTDCDDGEPSTHPGAPDVPDVWNVDADCDGIDGNLARSIFVSERLGTAGNDGRGEIDAAGSLVVRPVQTLDQALRAAEVPDCDGACDVLVAAGTYNVGDAPLLLLDGTDIYGGYWDTDWQHTAPIGATLVTGNSASGILHADAITMPTVVGFLTVQGADATAPAASTVGVLVTNTPTASLVSFVYVTLVAGDAGSGAAGGLPPALPCTSCPGAARTTSDPYCNPHVDSGFAAPSVDGAGAACPGGGRGGYSGYDTGSCLCGDAPNGDAGVQGGDGARPTAGGAAAGSTEMWGTFSSDASGLAWTWAALAGGNGLPGARGAGGGGGGCGGTGLRDGTLCGGEDHWWGGFGGAGGLGGCGGAGGLGGGAGGGAFALVLADSRVTLGGGLAGDRVLIRLGTGGRGGNGSTGGNATPGGPGSAGGSGDGGDPGWGCSWVSGGDGGSGGQGGNGAGGSGGAGGGGGPSVGVALIGADAGIDLGADEAPGEENVLYDAPPTGASGGAGAPGGRMGGSTTTSPTGQNGLAGEVTAVHCWSGAVCL